MRDQEQRRAELIQKQASKPGFRGKIDAKCIDCIYDPYSAGTWRKQVEDCTAPDCPLYPIRPLSEYQETGGTE